MNINPEAALAELKWLALAVSQDETRYALSQVIVDGKRAVATDGHRLHFIDNTVLPDGFFVRAGDLANILNLAKSYSLQEINTCADGTVIWHFESTDGSCTLECKPARHRFPEYQRVLPDPDKLHCETRSTKDLRKTYDGGEQVDYCVIADTTAEGHKPRRMAHFNASYVADALRGAPKVVTTFGPADEHSPVLFKYDNRGAVIMPVRQ